MFVFVKLAAALVTCVGFLVYTAVDSRGLTNEVVKDRTPYELNEFLTGAFEAVSWDGTWISGNEFYYKKDGNVVKYNVDTQQAEVLLEKSVLDQYPSAAISLSSDQKYVLIGYNTSSVFRHSTKSIFAVYDLSTKTTYDLQKQELLQYATFDVEGRGIAYVYDNNIYYVDSPEKAASPRQITTDGIPDVFYNGVPDWVYEEEVLASGSAMWFSPDGKKLAYATFDDKNVRNFTYTLYDDQTVSDRQYPRELTIKYPKVGTPNPVVKLHIYDLETSERVSPNIPAQENEGDYILYGVTWIANDEISLISTNRIQNASVITHCKLDGTCEEVAKSEALNGWLDPQIPMYSKDGTKRLEILPQPEGDDSFDHIVLTSDSESVKLTQGKRVVTSIYTWDEDKDLIYFAATGLDTPSELYLHSVTSTGEETCITCQIPMKLGTCKYAAGSFSKDNSHYVHVCRGPNPAYITIENVQDGTSAVWQDNSELMEKLETKEPIQMIGLDVPLKSGFMARARLLLPSDLDERKTYPAIVNVYGGPNSNQISSAYSVGFQNYLVTKKKYIYIYIDGRGSGKDGTNKLFQIYKKLGTVEIEDQIEVAQYLQATYSFIDKQNTAIWGWSYGGFATAWALAKDTQNVFKCGISVAPVVNFIYYDTIYTERYMGLPTPEDNLVGYVNNDVTTHVENMRNKSFYLIHGNADDNVHYQQSMLLSRSLELNDILFEQQSYPEENHSLGHVSLHLYHSMDRFWDRCFENRQTESKSKDSINAI